MKFILLVPIISIALFNITPEIIAQKPQYLKNEYVFPVNPDGKVVLTGNMGEIRPNHFHGGLDIGGYEGMPIYAIGDGYISRIKASTYGYGNVIYITHPKTNHVSVYAHLVRFNDKIAAFLKQKQYEQQTFEIEIFPSPDEVLITKKEIIAFMGNTGASFGSHLHFEIRTTADHLLNPLLFYDKQKDTTPPLIGSFRVMPLCPNARLNSERKPLTLVATRNKDRNYSLAFPISASGTIGFELITYDLAEGAANIYATTQIRLKANQQELYYHNIENVPMYELRCMNLHINYLALKQTGANYQRAYQTDGNRLDIRPDTLKNGFLQVQEGKTYDIEIEVADVHNNKSTLKLQIQGKKPINTTFKAIPQDTRPPKLTYEIDQNTLILKAQGSKQEIIAEINGQKQAIPFAYYQAPNAVYIYDLKKGLPSKIYIANATFNITKLQIPSQTDFWYKSDLLDVHFPHGSLPDTSFLNISAKNGKITIGDKNMPLTAEIEVFYKYKKANTLINNKTAIYNRSNGGGFLQPALNDSTVSFRTKYFGEFVFQQDTQAPKIVLVAKNKQKITFSISDTQAGIQSFKGFLNGEFVLLQYESKNGLLWTDPTLQKPLTGTLEIHITDKLGNTNTQKYIL